MQGVLALCSGGNNTAALLVFLGVLALWVAVAVVLIVARTQPGQSLPLFGVLLLGVLVSVAVFALIDRLGFKGLDITARLMLAVLTAMAVGWGVGLITRRFSAGRAAMVAFTGSVLPPGFVVTALIAAFAIGTGCGD